MLLFTGQFTLAQGPGIGLVGFNGTITGSVFDADYMEPIEYANIVVYRVQDSSQVTGTITKPAGSFRITDIPPGTYYLEATFIGYETRIINNIEITPTDPDAHVGLISLHAVIIDVEGTEVVADRPALTFEIDKKVVNVSRHTTVTSGTAVDVLENVPSVNVDIEGNVSLRGSGNFTVLIDGRPTILDPSDALRQIPATMIENIEIITNPSAKYEPEGVSGIINVVMKKRMRYGISGIVNSKIGMDNTYGGDALLSYNLGTSNFFIGAYYSHNQRTGSRKGDNRIYQNDTTWYVLSDGESERVRAPYGIRGGMDLFLSNADKLSIGGRYGRMSMDHSVDLLYDEWTIPGDTHDIYMSLDEFNIAFRYYMATFDLSHTFSNKDHTLALHAYYSNRDKDIYSANELIDTNSTIISGQQNYEQGPAWRAQVKLDYKQPIKDNGSFELGYNSEFSSSQDSTRMYDYDTLSDIYVFMPQYSHNVIYTRDIHAVYGMLSWSFGSFGIQTGLRIEYTDRLIEMAGQSGLFAVERLDYFPSVHLSYKFTSGQQLMTSYTSRIQRPRGWYLEPFITWSDAYNVRSGNPDLKPEYIDSYELGFQTFIGKSLLSTEIFYRMTHNRIERIQSIYADNIILHSVDNVGTGQMLGLETMLDLKLAPWWNLNCTGNVFQNWIFTTIGENDISKDNIDWSVRFSNEFKPFKGTRLQINGRYYGPSITSQGQRDGYYTTDAAIKQFAFGKDLSFTLQARDIFGTGRHEFTTDTDEFYYRWISEHDTPVFSLSMQYNFNNYKPQRRPQVEQDFEGMDEM